VDLNPVRGRLVERAVDYRWSSALAHVEDRDPSGLLDMKLWKEICPCGDWAQALAWSNADEQLAERLRQATRTGRPCGQQQFATALEQTLQRPPQRHKPGPPKRAAAPTGTTFFACSSPAKWRKRGGTPARLVPSAMFRPEGKGPRPFGGSPASPAPPDIFKVLKQNDLKKPRPLFSP
jgi:putative transposase